MGSSLRNRFFFLAVAGLALVAFSPRAIAQALPHPVNISPTAATPAGLSTMTTYDARGTPGAANAGYYTRPVTVSNNTLAGIGRGLAKRTLPSLAFMAALDSAGWAIDQLTQQVNSQPFVPGAPITPGSVYYSWNGKTFGSRESLGAAVLAHHNATMGPLGYPATHIEYNDPGTVGLLILYGRPWASNYAANRNANAPANLYEPSTPAVPATNNQLADLIKNNPNLWNDALRNPDGSVNRNPDVMAEAQALANELASANPSPNPSQGWDTGQQGGPQQQGATELEFPMFCSWAAKVCELADWLRLDDESDWEDQALPEIEPSLDVSWSSGFGGGSCPAPVSVEVLGAEVVFPYQPLCDLAVYIKPIVLAGSALMAVMIVGGFRRAG
jgi:hypothetical protein